MRELKFRAWNGKRMRYDVNINDGKPVRKGYQWYNTENDVHDFKAMQFTGLKDKNLVDIYEGDLVNLLIPNEFQNTVFKIVYLLGGFSLESKDNSPTSIGFYFYGAVDNGFIKNWKECDGSLFKVIGNIHENKDLL